MTEEVGFCRPSGSRPFSLGERWQSRLSLLSGGEYQKPLTQKERGQLKMLANVLGPLTNEVMDWALKNWGKFASPAAAAAGLATHPTRPHIGFLLAHHHIAVQRIQAITAYEQLSEAFVKAPQALQSVAKSPPADPDDDKPYKPLPEEIAATLAKFKSH